MRVIHAAYDPTAASVSARVDGGEPVVLDLAYLNASGYFDVTSDAAHTLALFGTDETELLSWNMPALTEAASYTVVASSIDEMPVLFAAAADTTTPPSTNTAAVRVFHGLVGLESADVCLSSSARAEGVQVFTGIPLSSFGGTDELRYAEIPANGQEVTVQFRNANDTPCRGRVQGVARFTPVVGVRYTLVAVGRMSARPRIDRELLVCPDPPGTDTTCTVVPIANR